MSDLNSWKQFMKTGKVEDYLKIAAQYADEDVREGQEPDQEERQEKRIKNLKRDS